MAGLKAAVSHHLLSSISDLDGKAALEVKYLDQSAPLSAIRVSRHKAILKSKISAIMRSFTSLATSVWVLLSIALVSAQQNCYFGPGAGFRGPSELVPCNNTGISACCLLGDTCLPGNYADEACPKKCGWDPAKSPWIGLEYCTDVHGPREHLDLSSARKLWVRVERLVRAADLAHPCLWGDGQRGASCVVCSIDFAAVCLAANHVCGEYWVLFHDDR